MALGGSLLAGWHLPCSLKDSRHVSSYNGLTRGFENIKKAVINSSGGPKSVEIRGFAEGAGIGSSGDRDPWNGSGQFKFSQGVPYMGGV